MSNIVLIAASHAAKGDGCAASHAAKGDGCAASHAKWDGCGANTIEEKRRRRRRRLNKDRIWKGNLDGYI